MTMLTRAHQPLPDRDARLIAGLRRGDPGAVDAFVETYGARICRRIERILGNRADAEEVAQDVLLLIVRRIHLFGARAAFATWVHRIATNAALARLRHRRRNDSRWAAGPSDAMPAQIASAEEEVTRRELQGLLARAIATLPEPYRLPLVLHHLEGLSHDAIAARLGLGLAAVKSRVYRSRILVRRCLAPQRRPTTWPNCSCIHRLAWRTWKSPSTSWRPSPRPSTRRSLNSLRVAVSLRARSRTMMMMAKVERK
jgi:RNA polymerase sigma-70 factor (ECF subfamily)